MQSWWLDWDAERHLNEGYVIEISLTWSTLIYGSCVSRVTERRERTRERQDKRALFDNSTKDW